MKSYLGDDQLQGHLSVAIVSVEQRVQHSRLQSALHGHGDQVVALAGLVKKT